MSLPRLLSASLATSFLLAMSGCTAFDFTVVDAGTGEDGGGTDQDSGRPDAASLCGNGELDDGEECDPDLDACCKDTCDGPQAPGIVCREGTGPCDADETCNGTSTICPVDELAESGTECRPVAGACDVAETCTGDSDECPDDEFVDEGTECRAVAGVCDVAESCTGSAAACPTDAFVANTTECRASTAVCDAAENCSGSAAACPADAPAATTVECRASTGACDPAEMCNGTDMTCPADAPPCSPTDLGSTVPQSASGSTATACNVITPSCPSQSATGEALFTFTAPNTGTYAFDTRGSTFDTVLVVLDGAACGADELKCDDDDDALLADPYNTSRLEVALEASETVLIAVDGWGTGVGDFVLNVSTWTCAAAWFGGSDGCDCGCGVIDPDCTGGTSDYCAYCAKGDEGGCSPKGYCTDVLYGDNSRCADWTCTADWKTDGACDCGCGLIDGACADETTASCAYCDSSGGSCATDTVNCTDIDNTNNAICI